jgi:putative transposase
VIKTFKYRLFPTKRQLHRLDATLEECRWLYNQTLACRKDAWEAEQRNVSWYDTNARIPILKAERPSLKLVHSQVLQEVTKRIDLAFKAFFSRVNRGEKPGYPRFKGYGRYDSFTYTQSGFTLDTKTKRLDLSKIGEVYIELHRPLKGAINTLTIMRSSTDKWYACFSVECDPNLLPPNPNQVGLDAGLTTFATLSDGHTIENPRFFRQSEKALAKAQRKLSKTAKPAKGEKASPERVRARKVVAHTHERTKFKRQNFTHQESRKIIDRNGFVAVEDLRINHMNKNHCLAKSIMDAAWSSFFDQLCAKAGEAGRTFVKVNPAYTSQTCSTCGYRQVTKLTLADRLFDCPNCHLQLDRDLNASLNIKALGLQSVGLPLDAPPFTAGE